MPNGVTFENLGNSNGGMTPLPDTQIYIGNALGVAAPQALSLNATGGAFSLSNTGVLTMPNASALTRGLLTAADWIAFNGKQASIPDWQTAFSSATQATSTWSAVNAAADVNAAIVPKGTGSFLIQLPDGAASGGNSRGQYAVDLQRIRSSASQVASGNYSSILGGINNTISSIRSFIGSGTTNTIIAGADSAIVGGSGNTINVAANGLSFIVGGILNSITAAYSFIGGGDSNTNAGTYTFIGGGQQNTVNSIQWGFIGGGFSNQITGNGNVIVGGYDNTGGGTYSFVGGGQSNNLSSGQYATLVGGQSNYINSNWGFLGGGYLNQLNEQFTSIAGGRQANATLYGMQAYSSGQFSALGDAQMATIQMRRAITGTAIAELFLDGASTKAILPATNALWMAKIQLAAICTAQGNGTTTTGGSYVAEYWVGIKRIGTTTSLVGAVQTIGTDQHDGGMSTSVVTITANDVDEALKIEFTPPSATAGSTSTFRVVATIHLTQIKY